MEEEGSKGDMLVGCGNAEVVRELVLQPHGKSEYQDIYKEETEQEVPYRMASSQEIEKKVNEYRQEFHEVECVGLNCETMI